jgi:hypothetical protein
MVASGHSAMKNHPYLLYKEAVPVLSTKFISFAAIHGVSFCLNPVFMGEEVLLSFSNFEQVVGRDFSGALNNADGGGM